MDPFDTMCGGRRAILPQATDRCFLVESGEVLCALENGKHLIGVGRMGKMGKALTNVWRDVQ